MTLSVGVARKFISPPPGIYLIGYGDRTSGNHGVHDDLTATALALDDGLHRLVIVACDLLAINELTVARITAQVGSHVLICCSHTHSAPITYAGPRASRLNRKYVNYLVAQITLAVKEAFSDLTPARLFSGVGKADIAVNRRERKADGHIEIGVNPTGPIDRSLNVIQAKSLDGKPIITVVNFQCHGTVLGPKNMLVSADWIGAMRKQVETTTGAPIIYLQGATGDLNPDHTWGEDDFSAVEQIGNTVARQVMQVIPSLSPVSGETISFHQEQVWLALDAPVHGSTPPPAYRRVLGNMAHVPRFLVDFVLNYRYPWKTQIVARDGFWSVPVVLSYIRAGDLALFALGAEVFTEIGMIVKQASHTAPALFASLSSGCIGYLPTKAEHALGGYEVEMAPYFYRLPGRLQPDSADRVIRAAKEMTRIGIEK